MGAADEPDRYRFLRGGVDPRLADAERRAAWLSVSTGKALADRLENDGLAAAQRRLAKYRAQAAGGPGLKPGFTRGGRPLDDA